MIDRRVVRSSRARLLVAAALLGGCAVAPLATRPDAVSWTAEVVAATRAIAARHPDPKLRNPDYLAERFVSPAYWRDAMLKNDYDQARPLLERGASPSYFYVNARTHHIEALLVGAAGAGATQVVTLGAGFDTRAYRFHERFPAVRFFELDLPGTIKAKQDRVAAVFGRLPDHVVFVSTNLDAEPLERALGRAGYDPAQRTFFIWEGVTMFISQAANERTLAFVRSASAPGSSIVFDYLLSQVVRGDVDEFYGARGTVAGVAARGEPYVTGWTPEEAAALVARHGLTVVSDLGPRELTERYLIGSDGRPDGRMADFARIMHASVSP